MNNIQAQDGDSVIKTTNIKELMAKRNQVVPKEEPTSYEFNAPKWTYFVGLFIVAFVIGRYYEVHRHRSLYSTPSYKGKHNKFIYFKGVPYANQYSFYEMYKKFFNPDNYQSTEYKLFEGKKDFEEFLKEEEAKREKLLEESQKALVNVSNQNTQKVD